MPPTTSRDPLVGRLQELAGLITALESAMESHGGLVMLLGDPGIGKTRLVEELEGASLTRGALTSKGICYEGGSSPPYWPWSQVIRSLLSDPSEAILTAMSTVATVIAEIVPEVRELFPEIDTPPALDPEPARVRLFDSVTYFLGEVASLQPTVVILDDLHWADRSSLELLEYVARDIASASLLVVGVYRGKELSRQHPLSKTLATLARSREFQRIHLRGMTRDEVGQLVEVVSKTKVPPSWISEIYDRTEGNPFFIIEVTREHVEEGAFGSSEIDFAGPFRIPDGVREAIGLRLNRLSEECNQMLRSAAVVGREFELELMKRLFPDLTEEQFLSVLEEALSAGVIEEIPDAAGHCRFTHMLIQETLSTEYSSARRAGVHGEIGKALEELYDGHIERHAAELAYHFGNAETSLRNSKLERYSLIAGESALATYAWAEAQSQFQLGLTVKDGGEVDADTAALLFGLARAQTHTLERHRIHEAAETVRPAFNYYLLKRDIIKILAITEHPFRMEGGLGLTHLFDEALKLVPPDSLQAGRFLSGSGLALSGIGEIESAIAKQQRALTIAQNENDETLEMTALSRMASAHFMIGLDPQKSLDYSLQVVELGRRVNEFRLVYIGHWWAAVALISLGEIERAKPHAVAQLEQEEIRGGPFGVVQGFISNEAIAHLQGNWQIARDFSDRGLAADHRDARLISNRAKLEYEQGDSDQGDTYLDQLVETMRLTPPGPTLEYSITSLAIGVAARVTGVNRHFEIAEEAALVVLSSPSPTSFFVQLARTGLALIAIERGDTAAAREQYDALLTWRMALAPLNLTCGHRVLGLLAQTLGRMNDAIAHLEDSLVFCRKAGALPELAWTSYDYAGALLQRDEPDDHSYATTLVGQALTTAAELGMQPLAERATALQEKMRQLPQKTPDYPAGLTPRELEVLRLVASGNSNAEIARELVLSVRTVERHISNIYSKTGSTGRANATAFAFTNRLMSDPTATT